MNTKQLLRAEDLEFDLSDRMRRAMRACGISRAEVAEELEVNPNSVSNWINGNTRPRRRDLRDFADLTGAPLEWLETGEPPTNEVGGSVEPPAGIEPATYSLQGYEIPDTVADLLALWAVEA